MSSPLSRSTREELPTLEATLRHWRTLPLPLPTHRRRVDREALRLLGLCSQLREELGKNHSCNASNAVLPFLEVVRSQAAGTEAKSAAVRGLVRLIPELNAPEDAEALIGVTEAVLECRFEQTDSGDDDVAMIWLLEALAACARVERALPEELMFRIVETLYDACVAPFNSGTTKAVAIRLATEFVRNLFAQTHFSASASSRIEGSGAEAAARENVEYDQDDDDGPVPASPRPERVTTPSLDSRTQDTLLAVSHRTLTLLVELADPDHHSSSGIGSIVGSFGRLVALKLLFEAIRATAQNDGLRIVKDRFLLGIIKDDLLRTLTQTVQTAGVSSSAFPTSTPSSVLNAANPSGGAANNNTGGSLQSPTSASSTTSSAQTTAIPPRPPLEDPNRIFVITEALRLVNLLFGQVSCRRELKCQFECFFNSVYGRIMEKSAARKMTRPDEAVLVIESFCDLLSDPSVLCDAFTSYDLHLQSTDVFENTFKLLSRLAFPHQLSVPALDGFRLLSLRGLLGALKSLTAKSFVGGGGGVSSALSSDELTVASAETWSLNHDEAKARELKLRKLALNRCAEAFNAKPKLGIQALTLEGVLSNPPDPLVLASFLRNTPVLEKTAIGQYLGEEGELNRAVLRSFTETFDIRDRALVDALRTFLECFRLPKEAQQIDRIVQAFADVAMAQCSDAPLFASVDACYILCFAIIMLNTDLHNPNVRPEKKMTLKQFMNTNRNYGDEISKGVNVPEHFLTSVYTDIATREINTMKDGSSLTAEMSRDRWNDLLARNREVRMVNRPPSIGYQIVMFETVWRPALAAVSVVFDSGQAAEQPDALHSALDGFLTLAKAAARFHNRDAFDSVIAALCKFTSLLVYGSDPCDVMEGSRAFVGLVRDFGNNHKGQMAAMSVFALTRRFGMEIRKSWRHVVWSVLRLGDLKLLPGSFYVESTAPLDAVARLTFHKKIKEACLRLADTKTKKAAGSNAAATVTRGLASTNESLRPTTSSSGGGGGGFFLTNWLFGSDDDAAKANAKFEYDDEQRALMSAMKVADAFCLNLKVLPQVEPSAAALAAATQQKFDAGDVLAETEQDIWSRMDEVPLPSVQYAAECIKSCRPMGVVVESKNLSEASLLALIDALFHALGVVVTGNVMGSLNTSVVAGGGSGDVSIAPTNTNNSDCDLGVDLLAPPSSGSKLIAIHMLTELVLVNRERFDVVWPHVSFGFLDLLRNAHGLPSFQVEIICVGLLRVCNELYVIAPERLMMMIQSLKEFFAVAPGLDQLVGRTVLDLMSKESVFWREAGTGPVCGWSEFYSLLEGFVVEGNFVSATYAFEALRRASQRSDIDPLPCARCAALFATTKWPQSEQNGRESAAVDLIFGLIENANFEAGEDFLQLQWIPLMREMALIAQSEPVSLVTRKRTLSLLLRAILNDSRGKLMNGEKWFLVLENVVFPLCQFSLRDGESGTGSPLVRGGEAKIMISSCELLCKIILAYSSALSTLDNFPDLWLEVLQFLERFKQAGIIRASAGEPDGGFLSEIVSEHLKNVLLHLAREGVLSQAASLAATGSAALAVGPKGSEHAEKLWETSWALLKASPALVSGLFDQPAVVMQEAQEGKNEEKENERVAEESTECQSQDEPEQVNDSPGSLPPSDQLVQPIDDVDDGVLVSQEDAKKDDESVAGEAPAGESVDGAVDAPDDRTTDPPLSEKQD